MSIIREPYALPVCQKASPTYKVNGQERRNCRQSARKAEWGSLRVYVYSCSYSHSLFRLLSRSPPPPWHPLTFCCANRPTPGPVLDEGRLPHQGTLGPRGAARASTQSTPFTCIWNATGGPLFGRSFRPDGGDPLLSPWPPKGGGAYRHA